MGSKIIPLTQGKFAVVDEDDFAELSRYNWHLSGSRNKPYAIRKARINDPHANAQKVYMHKQILNTFEEVDHKDRDSLNNTKENLRLASRSQNARNRTSRKNSSSRYLGVCRHKAGGWLVQAKNQGVTIYLGYYADEEEAARAYDKYVVKNFGEFANPNFPEIGGCHR